MKEEFAKHLRGPLVVRTSYTPDSTKPRQVVGGLVVAPGVRFVSPRDEAAARTVYIDIEVRPDGEARFTTRYQPTDLRGLAPERLLVGYPGWKFLPFAASGRARTARIRNVPVRVLFVEAGAVGRVAIDGSQRCKQTEIKRHRHAFGGEWDPRPIFKHGTEIRGDGSVVFVGEGDLIIPGAHNARVESSAVAQLFARVMGADLLRVDMSARAELPMTDHLGEIGSLAFECDGRTLMQMPTSTRMGGDRQSIDDEVRILSGVDRWTRGNDETFATLAAQGWIVTNPTFQNMKFVRAVAQHGTLKGVLDMVRRGVPVSSAQQSDLSPENRALVLGIVANRGEGAIVNALLEEKIKWSREELTEAFRRLAEHSDAAVLSKLIAAGADAWGIFGRGQTALMSAAKGGYTQTIAAVLRHDGRVNARDKDGCAPLHYLVRTAWPPYRRHADSIELLVKHGANVNARDRKGATPLFDALYNAKIAASLLRLGADPNIARGWDRPLTRPAAPDVALLLIAHGADVNATDKDGRTPLMLYGSHPDIVRMLIRRGARIDAKDAGGETALMKCPVPAVAELLLRRGADPQLRNMAGETALTHLRSREAACGKTVAVIERWMRERRKP